MSYLLNEQDVLHKTAWRNPPLMHHAISYYRCYVDVGCSAPCWHAHFAPLLFPYQVKLVSAVLVTDSPINYVENGTTHDNILSMSGSDLIFPRLLLMMMKMWGMAFATAPLYSSFSIQLHLFYILHYITFKLHYVTLKIFVKRESSLETLNILDPGISSDAQPLGFKHPFVLQITVAQTQTNSLFITFSFVSFLLSTCFHYVTLQYL